MTIGDHIEQNIETIVAHQESDRRRAGPWQRILESLNAYMSRPGYLFTLVGLIVAWIGINATRWYMRLPPWDAAPFAILDSAMTLVGLVTGTVVLVAQARQAKVEQQHTQLTLQISLLTEQKVTKLIHLLEELRRDLPMVHNRDDPQARAMQESADTAQLLTALESAAATGAPPAAESAAPTTVR